MSGINYSKLRGAIVTNGFTQESLASAMGIGLRSLNRKLNKHVPFNQHDIVKICETLHIPIAESASYFFDSDSQ